MKDASIKQGDKNMMMCSSQEYYCYSCHLLAGSNETQVLDLPIIDTLSQRPPYLPLAIPRDISERLIRLHGDPAAWWVGQFLKYMLKFQPKTQEMLDSMSESLGFQRPIVGYVKLFLEKTVDDCSIFPDYTVIPNCITCWRESHETSNDFSQQNTRTTYRQGWNRGSLPFHQWVHGPRGTLLHQTTNQQPKPHKESVCGIWWPNSHHRGSEKVRSSSLVQEGIQRQFKR